MGKKPISEEEYTTNKVLTVFSVCLLGVLVLMILQRLLNYGSTFMIGLIVTKILLAIGIIGVVGGLVMLGMERTGRRNGSRRIICGRNLLIASVVMTVCMSAISYIGIAPIKALYVILPVLAVFYLVYHSYSTEFFVITGKPVKVGLKDYWDTLKNNRAIQMLVLSASTDKLFMSTKSNATVMICLFGIIFGMIAGIMVFISLDELLPAAEESGKHHHAIYGLVVGMAVMALSLLMLG